MHILIATDAKWIVDELTAALGGPDTTFTTCDDGRAVAGVVRERLPDLAILDLQIGSMGGIAITMALRLDESGGLLPHVPVLLLLDRRADVFLAQRSGAEGWLVKPLDALRLNRAVASVTAGEPYTEAVPATLPQGHADGASAPAEPEPVAAAPEEEPAAAG